MPGTGRETQHESSGKDPGKADSRETGLLPKCNGAFGDAVGVGSIARTMVRKQMIRGSAGDGGKPFLLTGNQKIKTKRKDEGKEMERTVIRRQKKERIPSRVVNFLRREGRRCCAAALCVSMVMGNVAQAAVEVGEDADGTILYDLDSISLYGALQKAVLDGNPVEKEFLFEGEEAESYAQLLGETEDLYELKPEMEGRENGLELRIFAHLNQDIELDRGYEISGDENIVFLLTNKSRQTRTAVIQVDQKKSEEIPVPPRSSLGVDAKDQAYLSAADMSVGPDAEAVPGEAGVVSGVAGGGGMGSGGSGGGSGSGGGGGSSSGSGKEDKIGASDTLEGMVDPEQADGAKEDSKEEQADTDNTPAISIETEKAPEGQKDPDPIPDVNIVNPDNSSQGKGENHQEAEAEGSDSAVSEGNATGGGDEAGFGQGAESGNDDFDSDVSSGNDGDSAGGGNSANSGSGDNGTNHAGSGNSGDNGHDQNSGTTDNNAGGSAGNTGSNTGGDQADTGSNGNGNEVGSSLTISRHRVGLVALAKTLEETVKTATPSEATPSNQVEEDEASPSNAEANLLEGIRYEPVIMDGDAVVAFAVTAGELGLDDERFQMMVIYEPETPLEGVKVRVGVSPDAFSEEVTLHVKELKPEGETLDQYQLAEESLAKEGIQYEGMAALDISFLNAEGEEIEPGEEALVSIQMDRERLPEGISPETISVQHHKKDGESGEIAVEQVVDPAKAAEAALRLEEAEAVSREVLEEVSGGVLEVNDEALVTEFSVESFSTFTITWQGITGESRSVQIHYVDESGEEITCNNAPTEVGKNFTSNTTVMLSDYAFSIDGYIYQGAHLGSVSGEPVTEVKGYYLKGYYWFDYYFQYSSDGSTWKTLADNSDIYLVYKGSTPTPPTPGQNQDMTHDKKAVRREDGTYDLTLTVSGAFGSESNKALLDVIYVVDESNSMTDDRFTSTKKAITGLTNALAGNSKIDPRFSVVTFSGTTGDGRWNDAEIKIDWTQNPSSIANVAFSTNGGTNYQAGIRTAKELLQTKRERATTAVIFISDGDPTYYYTSKTNRDEGGKTTGNGSSYDSKALNAAKTEVSTLAADYFFTVGVGDINDYQKLRDLMDAAPDTTTKKFFSTSETDTNSLTNAFNQIQDSITTFLCSDVTVRDTLSDEVKIVETAAGTPEEPEILVTREDENGNAVIVAQGKSPLNVEGSQITASYAEINGTTQIIMDFPDNYELKKGYTYQVKAHIEPTEAAYAKYRGDGWNLIYQDNPEEGTGTHADSNEQGIYSNTNAVVSYKYKEEQKNEDYSKPVIQLNPGELKIEKTITGLDSDDLSQLINGTTENPEGLSFKTTFSWEGKTEEVTLPLKNQITGKTEKEGIRYEATVDPSGKYTIHFKGLSPDTRYSITEEHTDVEGYSLAPTTANERGTVGKGETKIASFTNTYTKKLSLTIKKKVEGNMGDTDHSFQFTYQVVSGGSSEEGTFSLKNDGSFVINNLPAGAKVIVTETDGSDYTTEITKAGTNSWKPTGSSDWKPTGTGDGKPDITSEKLAIVGKSFELTMTDTEEITFINTKTISSPTGLHSNRLPHLLLLAMAALGMAGMAATGATAKARRKDDDQ